ncbi:hypothetical protein CKAH01_16788 [Colletotrichum kahawae]|uniref:Lipoprotein n=1 Tax=Colletotrichum kahawae TaxID=34407 RepID=A0AAD9YC30_COLKA|nr:hypothetical protein CKAH01_16788 [Colletotrichum kahawae]
MHFTTLVMAVTACAALSSACGIHPYKKGGGPGTPGVPAHGAAWADKEPQAIKKDPWVIKDDKSVVQNEPSATPSSKLASRRYARAARA